MKYLPIIIFLVVVAAVGGVLLTKDNEPASNTNTTQPTKKTTSDINSPVNSDKVSIVDFAFTPANITVKQGTTVVWTNNDSTPHTVSRDSPSGPDSQALNSADTFSFTFNEIGTFGYHCNIHQDMHGTVQVTN